MLAHKLTAVVTWLAPIRTLRRMPTAPLLSYRNRISRDRFRNLFIFTVDSSAIIQASIV